jgi:hypothetical protein
MQHQIEDDDVVIVSETKSPVKNQVVQKIKQMPFTEGLELDQPAFYKLKAMSLLKLLPGKGWAKVAAVNVYLAKCA